MTDLCTFWNKTVGENSSLSFILKQHLYMASAFSLCNWKWTNKYGCVYHAGMNNFIYCFFSPFQGK